MAFVPNTSFLPRASVQIRPQTTAARRRCIFMAASVKSADAMDFFRHREGQWESWRVTHHLAFRRSESGESVIKMQCLDKDDERIVTLCNDHQFDPTAAQGGCYVTWRATMAWDQEGENHEGSTVFALVPEKDDIRRGKILRDRGYAEIVPIAGTYYLDDNDDLNLETPYDGGEVQERFSFDGPDVVNRTSTVRRFGGFSTATFATERRVGSETIADDDDEEEIEALLDKLSFFGGSIGDEEEEAKSSLVGANRWGTPTGGARPSSKSAFGSGFSAPVTINSSDKPSVKSAFGSGFGGPRPSQGGNGAGPDGANDDAQGDSAAKISTKAMEAAQRAGIDLTKIPPSMRDDFVASFDSEGDKSADGS